MPSKAASRKPRSARAKSTPSEIAPGVFVGGWKEAVAFSGTRFCVLDESPADMPPATHIRIYDEASGRADIAALDRLAKGVGSARRSGEPVMIFCGHGVMRSPLGGIWYLHRAERLPVDAAYDRVHGARPKAVHPRTWLRNAEELEGA